MVRKVTWTQLSLRQLRAIGEYISQDSLQNAKKVVNEIVDKAFEVARYPETQRLDSNRKRNGGGFRYFIKHRYRVYYRITKQGIRILRIKHTKRK